MSRGINRVTLIGNLGKDPEMRQTNNGIAIANISVATSESWKDKTTGEAKEKTEWHRCVAFQRTAEIIGQYLAKGSKVYIDGSLHTRKWQDQTGQDRYTTEIKIRDMQMLDSKGGNNQQQGGQQPQQQGAQHYQQPQTQVAPDFHLDDDIPF